MMIGTVVAVTYSVVDRSMKGAVNARWLRCGERLARKAIAEDGFRALQAERKERDRAYVSRVVQEVQDTVGPCTPEVGAVRPTSKQLHAFSKGFEGVVGKNY